jgi:hypothetical protein
MGGARKWRREMRVGYWWQSQKRSKTQVGGMGGVEWIVLAQDRDSWRVLVNVIMNLLVP